MGNMERGASRLVTVGTVQEERGLPWQRKT
jgi:hypothetical protein